MHTAGRHRIRLDKAVYKPHSCHTYGSALTTPVSSPHACVCECQECILLPLPAPCPACLFGPQGCSAVLRNCKIQDRLPKPTRLPLVLPCGVAPRAVQLLPGAGLCPYCRGPTSYSCA